MTRGSLTGVCHACQLGRHTCLPFTSSTSRASPNFELLHCDLWTSPAVSVSGFKYYLVILDDCSHFVWTFPLRFKSNTFSTLSHFFTYVKTQFATNIRSVQCDNGREFDNSAARTFFLTNGVHLQMSCPHTSPQNGKAECILRSLNNIVRSLLFQAQLPGSLWVEALNTATYLINRHPIKTLGRHTTFFALYGTHLSYSHLRVFGCKCYPNLSATTPHKLAPRSTMCVFLGYPLNHKGYRCFDPVSNRVIISRHVVFDEHSFPYTEITNSAPSATDLEFLEDFSAPMQAPIGAPRRLPSHDLAPGLTDGQLTPWVGAAASPNWLRTWAALGQQADLGLLRTGLTLGCLGSADSGQWAGLACLGGLLQVACHRLHQAVSRWADSALGPRGSQAANPTRPPAS